MANVGIGGAFFAGIASFLSPCVLPLVPGYLSFISGLSLEELARGADRKTVLRRAGLGAIFFGAGFSVVFTALGASASVIGQSLSAHMGVLTKLAGALIVVFGLHMSGVTPIQWLYYERRFSAQSAPPTFAGAFAMGLAFAFGWTPCIGPILASILALAATQQTVRQGMALLFVYSLGLGVPFLLAALAVEWFLELLRRYKRYIGWGEKIAGVLLIVVGVLVFSNRLNVIAGMLSRRYAP